jgi:hypothetical protein
MLYKEGECDRPADGKGEGDIPKTREWKQTGESIRFHNTEELCET